MDHVLERGDFTRKEIQKINYCRLYLQAITASDISNATGTTLMPGIRSGEYTIWSGVTHFHKTNQAKPDISTWRLWSRAMLLIADSNESLYVPLRQWIPPPHRQRFICPFYYDPLSDGLYFTRTDRFDYHRRISRRFFSYNSTDQRRILPLSAYPVTLHDHQSGWIVDSYNSYCPTHPSANPTSFEAFCSLLDGWESQLLLDIHLFFDPFILIAKLENSLFRACSDGSAVTQEGTYGWALSLEDGTRLAHGAGYVDGHDPRSFRAEGQGMLSVVCFIRRLLQWTCTDSVLTGILATDNTGLIA
jgi:hypothetical protein